MKDFIHCCLRRDAFLPKFRLSIIEFPGERTQPTGDEGTGGYWSKGSSPTGQHLCAVPGGDGDCVQCSQEIKDADTQQQPGEPDWDTAMVSKGGAGLPNCGCSGYEVVELLLS